jgi:hypothetical protein
LIFQNDDGFSDTSCEEGVSVSNLTRQKDRTAFIVDDISGREGGGLGVGALSVIVDSGTGLEVSVIVGVVPELHELRIDMRINR